MQFLRTLFWVILAVIAAIFANRNWTSVEIALWGGLRADVKLPVLLLFAFLLGLLPTLILHRTTRWRMRRRLDQTERALADARASEAAGVALREPAPASAPEPFIAPTVP